jgi:hypothetical protein
MSDQVLNHLVLGHFGFRVGSGIESFNVELFRVLNRIRSERVGRFLRFCAI